MSQRHSDHAHDQPDVPSDPALRVKALESLLVEKGLVDPAALDGVHTTFVQKLSLTYYTHNLRRCYRGALSLLRY